MERQDCAGLAMGRIADRLTIRRIPPIWGSKASKTRRSMAKSSPDGRSIPLLTQATILIAASVCGSAVCRTGTMAASRIWRRSTTAASRSRQNLPTPLPHSRSRADMASLNADWAAATAGVTRAARAVVTSAMLTDAKPIPAMTANTKLIAQTAHPARDAPRWPMCQSLAAQIGVTSAARSADTPMAMNIHPATSLDPSDRANQPFVARPTAASVNAAAAGTNEATDHRPAGATPDADGAGAAGGGAGTDSGNAGAVPATAESPGRNSAGIRDSEDSDLATFGLQLRGALVRGRYERALLG